ncbi:CDP-glycerol glycerophosphotransferase family protein [Mumia sp. zg.B21]|uniref:CDP-glycerol glycerophosphotransferase family protein n=1 Tax=Mumia sp. zg.B21 TaxID=2855447 RepID=UPI001C6E8B9C|nr:CDP-glycerol glycerophosphotransferase family protein [Mumia sp. zg.B21]MBW9209496.1 CDP-glycerol glycerophosphotransferase family protein [Mumia sp. zg.B21]
MAARGHSLSAVGRVLAWGVRVLGRPSGFAAPTDQDAVVILSDLRWVRPATVRLAGWAYMPGGDSLTVSAVEVLDPRGRRLARGSALPLADPDADVSPGDEAGTRADTGFTAEVDVSGLLDHPEGFRADVCVVVDDAERPFRWTGRRARSWARRPRASGALGDSLVRAVWSDERGLRLKVERAEARLEEATGMSAGVRLSVHGKGLTGLALVERNGGADRLLAAERVSRHVLVAEVERGGPVGDGDLVAAGRGGRRLAVAWSAALGAGPLPPELIVRPSGRVAISTAPALVVDSVVAGDRGILLEGDAVSVGPELGLELGSATRTLPGEVTVKGGRFEALLPYETAEWSGPRPWPADRFDVRVTERPRGRSVLVRLAPEGERMLPLCVVAPGARLRATVSASGRIVVESEPDLRTDERGPFRQRLLTQHYLASSASPRRAAYFECYYGASTTDSGRAIFDELVRRESDLDLVWGVADRSVPVAPGGRGVVMGSREWWDVLARASYLTFNAGLPPAVVRRPGQVIVQTWHGTPLKLLGADRAAVREGAPGWDDWTRRSVGRWDALLAPNPYSAEIFPRAWGYKGDIVQLGYPRNDALAGVDDDRATDVRRRLRIPDDHMVALYAPTWRDGDRVMPRLLDLEAVVRGMGDGFTLLVRGHMNIRGWESAVAGPAVRDVTTYPEINDLYRVADVAITDYSSIMFDYSVTRKPLVFFVPDLDDYRGRRRGLYFDLEETAPGPVLRETAAVVDALRELDGHRDRYARRYADWVATYNPLDDGHAAARVVDALYGGG